jgi:hypothetical protein
MQMQDIKEELEMQGILASEAMEEDVLELKQEV